MHTKEEQWHAKREEYRKDVANYYKAKRIARMIQIELGIGNLPNVDPWAFKNGGMREMAQLLRRSLHAFDNDKRSLGLSPEVKVNTHHWEERVMKNQRYYRRGVPNLRRETMSVERAAETLNEMLDRDPEGEYIFPKFHKELVLDKKIGVVFGSAKFMINQDKTMSTNYTGALSVVLAREIKADWLAEENIRAFKVVVLPDDDGKRVYDCVVGYAARSTITDDIKPAFGKDIAKAVSLCKRRVRAEVLKQMEI
jgi:hypothetical protein